MNALEKLIEKIARLSSYVSSEDAFEYEKTHSTIEPNDLKEANHVRFSDNIFEKRDILVETHKYKLFLARFSNLNELYDYLKSDPKINTDVFETLSSITGSSDFAGRSYEEAVEMLVDSVDPGYEEFLKLQGFLNRAIKVDTHKYKTVRTVAGGRLDIPAYSAGSPLCYETLERKKMPKFIKLHISLSYSWTTSKAQVYNRAIIITNIIKALESAGYNVFANAFELASYEDEIIHIVIDVKKHNQNVNMQALYKSLCYVEFLRRILFRVLETLDLENSWSNSYGRVCSESFIKKVLNLDHNDIFIGSPSDLGIKGNSLSYDFASAAEALNLSDKFDVEMAKKIFDEQSKKLMLKNKHIF